MQYILLNHERNRNQVFQPKKKKDCKIIDCGQFSTTVSDVRGLFAHTTCPINKDSFSQIAVNVYSYTEGTNITAVIFEN